jgi:hypothetical protein
MKAEEPPQPVPAGSGRKQKGAEALGQASERFHLSKISVFRFGLFFPSLLDWRHMATRKSNEMR